MKLPNWLRNLTIGIVLIANWTTSSDGAACDSLTDSLMISAGTGPDMAADQFGYIHIVWQDPTLGVMYAQVGPDGTITVPATSMYPSHGDGFPHVAVDNAGDAHIIASSSSFTGLLYLKVSGGKRVILNAFYIEPIDSDGVNNVSPSIAISPVDQLPIVVAEVDSYLDEYEGIFDPVLVPVYSTFIASEELDAGGNPVPGSIFEAWYDIDTEIPSFDVSYPSVAVDNTGVTHVVWVYQDPTLSGLTVGYANSASSTYEEIADSPNVSGLEGRPIIIRGSDGNLDVVWSTTANSVVWAQLNPAGAMLVDNSIVSQPAALPRWPVLASVSGQLVCSWTDSREGTNSQIYARSLLDTVPECDVSDSPGAASLGAMAITSTGNPTYVWQDNRSGSAQLYSRPTSPVMPIYWDPGALKSSPGSGGAGSWDNSTADWWQSGAMDAAWSMGDYAIFSGTAGTVTLEANVSADSLTFNSAGYVITGANTLTLNSPGAITVPSGNTSISCSITGTSGLNYRGLGTLTLSGANTYTGINALNGGILQVNAGESAGTSGPLGNSGALNPGNIVLNGGTLQYTSVNQNDYSGRFSLAASQVYNIDVNGYSVAFATALTSSGGTLNLSSSASGGTLTLLSAANTYTGTTTIGPGSTLTIGGTGSLGSGAYAGSIDNNGFFTYNSTVAQTLAGVISGTGSLNQSSGTLILSGANTYSGTTMIGVGSTLTIDGTGSLASGTSGMYAGALDISGFFIYNSKVAQTLSGVISGAGILTQSGFGTLTLSGANTYSGTISIGLGSTLTIGGAGLLGNGTYPGLIDNNGIFVYNSSKAQTLSGIISGAGELVQDGPGDLMLTGENSYTGGTLVNSGNVQVRGGGALGLGTLVVGSDPLAGDGILDLGGTSQIVQSTTISGGTIQNGTLLGAVFLAQSGTVGAALANNPLLGPWALIKSGADEFTLSGVNTYTGPTVINSGILSLGQDDETGIRGVISASQSLSIAAGATFDVSAYPLGYTLSSPILYAFGNGTASGFSAASIKGIENGIVGLASPNIMLNFQPQSHFGDVLHPSLYISQGVLALTQNSFFVNLGPDTLLNSGTYSLIQAPGGIIPSSGPFSVIVTEGGIESGDSYSIQVSAESINLIVSAGSGQDPSIVLRSPGTGGVANFRDMMPISGSVIFGDPMYPTNGEVIAVTIDGVTQTTTIDDLTGDFSLNYNLGSIPVSATPYVVYYSYPGDASLNPAINASNTVTVTMATPMITWSLPAPIAFGTALNSNQLNATASVPGNFTYNPTNGAVLAVGTNTLSVVFTPTDTNDYTSVTDTVSLAVSGVPPPTIQAAKVSGGLFTFSWAMLPTQMFQVQFTTNLASTSWVTLSGAVGPTNSTMTISEPIGPNLQQYYRVVLLP